MRPAIETMADKLLDAMADAGADGSAVEFMHDFAYLLPVTVICELIGIPETDREAFRPVARDLACRPSTPPGRVARVFQRAGSSATRQSARRPAERSSRDQRF